MAKVWPVWPEVDRGSCIVHRAREMYSPGDQDTKRSPERREGARGFFWCGVDCYNSMMSNWTVISDDLTEKNVASDKIPETMAKLANQHLAFGLELLGKERPIGGFSDEQYGLDDHFRRGAPQTTWAHALYSYVSRHPGIIFAHQWTAEDVENNSFWKAHERCVVWQPLPGRFLYAVEDDEGIPDWLAVSKDA